MKSSLDTLLQSNYSYALIILFLLVLFLQRYLPRSIRILLANQYLNFLLLGCILYYQLQSVSKTVLILGIIGMLYLLNKRFFSQTSESSESSHIKTKVTILS